jgi:AcrR family transcriptional regulator
MEEHRGMESIKGDGSTEPGRSAYHHGDLRNALLRAATELASAGGPEAVVLREAARRVGVSPTAAYRHFAGQGELLQAVKDLGQEELAVSMQAAVDECPDTGDPGEVAMSRAKAVGRGYLRFAFAEPGLFRTAFCHNPLAPVPDSPDHAGKEDYPSYALLAAVLDDLVTTGRMPPTRRPGAEITAWSAVHGLAQLVIDGPLHDLAPAELAAATESLLHTTTSGMCT